MLRDLPVADLTIEDPPIEDVIEHVFASATASQREAAAAEPSQKPSRGRGADAADPAP